MKNLKFKTKLFALIAVAVAGMVVFGVLSYLTLSKVKVGGSHLERIADSAGATGLYPAT